LGGIYFRIFTPIEAGWIGAFAALVFNLLMGRLSIKALADSLLVTARLTAMVFMLLMGAMVFNTFLGLSRLPQALSLLVSHVGSGTLLVIIILIIYFPLGCFMDTASMLVLTIPLFLPTLMKFNIDLIWFGVLVVISAEIALITPPVGMNAFVVKGTIGDISLEQVFQGVLPFVFVTVALLIIVFLIPDLAVSLPGFVK
jgi:tripartite ATP-independent transporter DctM subunit